MNDDPIAAKLAAIQAKAEADAAAYQSTPGRKEEMRSRAAHHEAAHAFAVAVRQLRLGGSCICPPSADHSNLDWGGDTTWDPPGIRVLADELVAAFAGEAAEQPNRPEVPDRDSTDGASALGILNDHCVADGLRDDALAEAWANAQALVTEHAAQIEAIAGALLDSGCLDGEDLRRVVSEVLRMEVAAADDPQLRGCCSDE